MMSVKWSTNLIQSIVIEGNSLSFSGLREVMTTKLTSSLYSDVNNYLYKTLGPPVTGILCDRST